MPKHAVGKAKAGGTSKTSYPSPGGKGTANPPKPGQGSGGKGGKLPKYPVKRGK